MCRALTKEEKLLAEQRQRKADGRRGVDDSISPVAGAGHGEMDHFHEEVKETETPVCM